jgi:AcrR family transcriptional regulator
LDRAERDVSAVTGETRPLRADARRNRARIIEVARTAFATEGLSVPIDEIARRADVGPGTVHRHFPAKENLFEAIILADIEGLAARAESLTEADDPGAAFFGFLDHMVGEGSANRALADALAGVGHDLKAGIATASERMNVALGVLLRRAQDAGAVRDDFTFVQLRAMLGGIHVAGERQPHDPGLARQMLSIFCDGLRPRGG